MGPLGHGGSASKSVLFKAATGATGLIQLGMAFGIDPSTQRKGDVLVSTSIIPYDNRDVVPASEFVEVYPLGSAEVDRPSPDDGDAGIASSATPETLGYRVDYASRVVRHRASPSLLAALRANQDRATEGHRVFFGGMLSGGARIFSTSFLRELVLGVPAAEDGVVGGDMEGVGLLSSSPFDDPAWVVVKGISDFADDARHRAVDVDARTAACRNSARFVLDALRNFNVE